MNRNEYMEQLLPLVKETYPMACRMLKDDALAEDAIQEVMLKLWHNRENIDISTSIKSFLYKAVRNKCLDIIKRKEYKTIVYNTDNIRELATLPKDEFDTMQWIDMCIESLPKTQKKVLRMREIDDLDFCEIGELLEMKEAHVRVLLSRAKKALKEMLKKEY